MNRFAPYRHGGNPLGEFRRFSIEPRMYIDFSVNINPLGPPPIVRHLWKESFNLVTQYPSVCGEGIRMYFHDTYGCDPSTVFPGNGASEVLHLLFRVLSPDTVVYFTPSYQDYSQAALLNGATILSIALSPDDNFTCPSVSRIAEKISCADALIIGQPNNPTGTFLDRDSILDLATRFSSVWIIVDESFVGFLPCPQRQSLLYCSDRPDNVIIVQSLTKYYALPGLRLGSCVASPRVINRLEQYRVPWSVNTIADSIAPALSNCTEYDRATANLVTTERTRLFRELSRFPELTVFPSEANFILGRWNKTDNLDDFLKSLLRQGIVLRDCRNFPGLENNYFRTAILDPKRNDMLLNTMNEFMRI